MVLASAICNIATRQRPLNLLSKRAFYLHTTNGLLLDLMQHISINTKLVSWEKQLKAASSTNGNFSSSRIVWRKCNTFKTLAVCLKMIKYSEKIFYLFQLKYRQEARRCLTSLDVVFGTGQHWKCCRERDVNIIIRELGHTTSKLTGSRAQTIPRDIPSFSRHSNIVLMVTWLKKGTY